MLNFIKKLFGFGKTVETKVEATLTKIQDLANNDDSGSTITIPVAGIRTKEEAEKVFQERIAEIEAEKNATPVIEASATPVEPPKAKKKKKYYAPKKATTEAPKAPVKKETAPKPKVNTPKTPKPKK